MRNLGAYVTLLMALLLCSYLLVAYVPGLLTVPRSESEVILGTPDNDVSEDMAIDSEGNVIVVGRSETDFETGRFFMVKVSSEGQELWRKIWNESMNDVLVSVIVDSLDNIIVAGAVRSSDLEEQMGIVIKMSPDGDELWSFEIPGLRYDGWPIAYSQAADFLGLEMALHTDDIFMIGNIDDSSHKTLVMRLNSSGSVTWQNEWFGPAHQNGTRATDSWLTSRNTIMVTGLIYGTEDPYWPYVGSFLAEFDLNGTEIWNSTSGEYWGSYEIAEDRFVTATHGMSIERVACYTYDLNKTWEFDIDPGEHYSVIVRGFSLNGTDGLIGWGRVTSLLAGSPVTRSFSAKFSGPQPPQILVFSCSLDGVLQWTDFLVEGRMTEPCGCTFDNEDRLVIAGHTSSWSWEENDFIVVFGFRLTPVPPHYDMVLLGFFPILNLLVVGIAEEVETLFVTSRAGFDSKQGPRSAKRYAKATIIVETAFLIVLTSLLGGYGGGGPPSPLAYLPEWVSWLFWSLPVGILTLIVLYVGISTRQERIAARTDAGSNEAES
ncbi:MAG: hypothetical protein JSW05_10060 [Candidatus Thorarchaeota archaeon]|nr:MAG: hypothetical protein JSW05_10060 [Candidatus Thorarchaeota archaeon]